MLRCAHGGWVHHLIPPTSMLNYISPTSQYPQLHSIELSTINTECVVFSMEQLMCDKPVKPAATSANDGFVYSLSLSLPQCLPLTLSHSFFLYTHSLCLLLSLFLNVLLFSSSPPLSFSLLSLSLGRLHL